MVFDVEIPANLKFATRLSCSLIEKHTVRSRGICSRDFNPFRLMRKSWFRPLSRAKQGPSIPPVSCTQDLLDHPMIIGVVKVRANHNRLVTKARGLFKHRMCESTFLRLLDATSRSCISIVINNMQPRTCRSTMLRRCERYGSANPTTSVKQHRCN